MYKMDKEFIRQYLITALWSSYDIDCINSAPLDENFDVYDIDLATIKQAIRDCKEFINKAEKENLLEFDEYSTAGHDFWLTRNGHGAGFWDGDYKHGDRLTELSQEYRELTPMVYVINDDKSNKIEFV